MVVSACASIAGHRLGVDTVHIHYEREVADLFNIPADVTQAALLPIAYFKGADFKPAPREPGSTRTHWNQWNRAS
jgi:hypothetical protein